MTVFDLATDGDVSFLEGSRTAPATADGTATELTTAIIEAAFGAGTRAVLVYAEQLPAEFFDLSSRVAGDALQRLRNYGVRLAVVVPAGWAGGSSRFGEMVAEERRGRDFALFESRGAAIEWLAE
jgi:hypothetical protein